MRLKAAAAAALAWILLGSTGIARAAHPCVTAAEQAQDLRAANRLREARASLLVCAQRTCNAIVRTDCEKWLRAVDEQTPSVVVRAIDARGKDVLAARVTIDDETVALDGTAQPLDPGPHVVRARTSAGETALQRVLVAISEKSRVVEVRFAAALDDDGRPLREAPRRPPPRADLTAPVVDDRPSNVAPIVLLGVSGVALGIFGYFEIVGHEAYGDLEDGCFRTRSCTDAEIDPVKQKFTAAGIALGVSLVAIAAAAIVYATTRSSSRPAPLAALRF